MSALSTCTQRTGTCPPGDPVDAAARPGAWTALRPAGSARGHGVGRTQHRGPDADSSATGAVRRPRSRAVGELDLVAGPAEHHVGRHHPRRQPSASSSRSPTATSPIVVHPSGSAAACPAPAPSPHRPRRHDDHLAGCRPLVTSSSSTNPSARRGDRLGRDRVDLVHRRLQQSSRHEVFGVRRR